MIAGDPDEVESRARSYGTMATSLSSAVTSIDALTTSVGDGADGSEAVKKLVDSFDNVSKSLGQLHDRYDTANTNLLTYAAALRQAQQDASTAEHTEATAQTQLAHAQLKSDDAQKDWLCGPDEATKDQGRHDYLYVWAPIIDQHQTEIATAQKQQSDAEHTVHQAGDIAASNISGVIDHDGLNDKPWYEKAFDATVDGVSSFWKGVGKWVSDPENWISLLSNVGFAIDLISFIVPPPLDVAGMLIGTALQAGAALWKEGLEGWDNPEGWMEFGLCLIPGAAGAVGKLAKDGLRVADKVLVKSLAERAATSRMASAAGSGMSGMTREVATRTADMAEDMASRMPVATRRIPVLSEIREIAESNALARISTVGEKTIAPSVSNWYRAAATGTAIGGPGMVVEIAGKANEYAHDASEQFSGAK